MANENPHPNEDTLPRAGRDARIDNLEARVVMLENVVSKHDQRLGLLHTCIHGLLQVSEKLNIFAKAINSGLPKSKRVDEDVLFPKPAAAPEAPEPTDEKPEIVQ